MCILLSRCVHGCMQVLLCCLADTCQPALAVAEVPRSGSFDCFMHGISVTVLQANSTIYLSPANSDKPVSAYRLPTFAKQSLQNQGDWQSWGEFYLVGTVVPLSSNAGWVHARDDGLEALRTALTMRIELLAKAVVGHVRWQEDQPCSPPERLKPDLQAARSCSADALLLSCSHHLSIAWGSTWQAVR